MEGDYRNGNDHGIEKEIAIPVEKKFIKLIKWRSGTAKQRVVLQAYVF